MVREREKREVEGERRGNESEEGEKRETGGDLRG